MSVTTQAADTATLAELGHRLGRAEGWARVLSAQLRRSDLRVIVAWVNGRSAGYVLARVARRGRRAPLRRLLRWLWSGPVPDGAAIVQPHRVGLVDEWALVDGEDGAPIREALWQAAAGWMRTQGVRVAQTSVTAADRERRRQMEQLDFAPAQIILEWQHE